MIKLLILSATITVGTTYFSTSFFKLVIKSGIKEINNRR